LKQAKADSNNPSQLFIVGEKFSGKNAASAFLVVQAPPADVFPELITCLYLEKPIQYEGQGVKLK
jgi:hypothetical protein